MGVLTEFRIGQTIDCPYCKVKNSCIIDSSGYSCFECRTKGSLGELREKYGLKKIIYSEDKDMSNNIIQQQIKRDISSKNNLNFYVTSRDKLQGKVLQELKRYKQKIQLLEYRESFEKNKEFQIELKKSMENLNHKSKEMPEYHYYYKVFFLDTRDPKYKWQYQDDLSVDFYVYEFQSGEKTYILLSEEKLTAGKNYEFQGIVVDIPTGANLTKTNNLTTKNLIYFVNKNHINPLNLSCTTMEEALDIVKDYSDEEIKRNFFYHDELDRPFKFPKIIEELIMSFCFSSLRGYELYPLHLTLISNPGYGKSILLEILQEIYSEENAILEAGGCTVKTLIPSFKGTITSLGALLTAQNMCFVDEFFNIITRTISGSKSETVSGLSAMNNILEHKLRAYGSGNTPGNEPMGQARMSGKGLFVTNFLSRKLRNMKQLLKNFENQALLSRLLIYVYTKEDMEMIENYKNSVSDKKFKRKITGENWKRIVEYFQSVDVKFDERKVLDILKKHNDETVSQFRPRIKHHLYCLLDGIVKMRCLLTKNTSLVAIEEDYIKLEEMYKEVINSWKCNYKIKYYDE
jgi:hypothetical protein